MGEVLIDCPVCGIEMRNSIYRSHICLGDKIDDLSFFRDILKEIGVDEESDY